MIYYENIYSSFKKIDYINKLYKPLGNDTFFEKHELIFPHEKSYNSSNTRNFYKDIDVFFAECSAAATGLGIELGLAYDDNIKIYCIYQIGKRISNSLRSVTDNFYEYANVKEMVEIVNEIVVKEMN